MTSCSLTVGRSLRERRPTRGASRLLCSFRHNLSETTMRQTLKLGLYALGVWVGWMAASVAQPPGGGPPGGSPPGGGPPDGGRRPGGLVHLIPPFARDELNLTADQEKKIADLEKE